MSTYIQGGVFTQLQYGPQVTKTAQAIPNSTTSTLFTVNTGNVLITNLYGVTTTATTSATVTLSLGAAPTVGSASTTAIATATSIGTRETGTWVVPQVSSGVGGALVVGANGGAVLFQPTPFAAAPGGITWTTSANPGAGNKMTWYLNYVPLDPGAYVS